MKSKGKIFIAALIMTLACAPLMSQSSISGVVNSYTSIEQLVFREGSEVANAVLVSNTTGFSIGDTVMIYQPKGFEVDQSSGSEGRIDGPRRHVGKYTFLIIHDINLDTIIFNNSTGFDYYPFALGYRQYLPGETGQLIKVAAYENAVVDGPLTAQPWDPVSNTGGVVALFVKEKLTLNAPIDVSGKGFKGGDPGTDDYTGSCYSEDEPGLSSYFYLPGDVNKAGLKGEGASDTTFLYTRGKGSIINGGGGGNAKYSGGGGGSNYSSGGNGGNESSICTSASSSTNGLAGYELGVDGADMYTNNRTVEAKTNRIFMGGGGGSGTQNIGAGYPSSRGGNGGGIVVIIADTLESTLSNPILAKGESVVPSVAGSGGGGGAGGSIVLDVSHYKGDIELSAEGGTGGNTNGILYAGPGGGGGGGVYWLRYDSSNVAKSNTAALGGKWNDNTSENGDAGKEAGLITDLRVPLDGFLFNTLPGPRTVCTDETPPPINASSPKGGDENNYVYEWYYRLAADAVIDTVLDPTNTDMEYTFRDSLTVNTIFYRKVSSGSLFATDSIIYTVLPRIRGNDIMAPDTVCYGLAPVPLVQHKDSTLRSANVATDTSFLWIGTTNGTDWFDAPETNNRYYYAPSEVFETTTFTRIARSGVCDDTSNQVVVTVLPSIENNTISQDTILCYMQTPDELRGTTPTGGDGEFHYKWEVADNIDSLYTQVAATQHYQPPKLDSLKYYYRRIYYSGRQDACKDTTDILTIEVLPFISNNDLITAEDTVCQDAAFFDPGITAEQPAGGREGSYTYIWQVSDDLSNWGDSATMNANDPFNLDAFPAKRYIRRVVKSGMHDVCRDTSGTLVVNVIPSVNNNTLITTDYKACQDIVLPELTANTVTGGDLTYGTLWQSSTDGVNFDSAAFINNQPDSYSPGALLTTTYFRREVWSADDLRKVCDTFSDTLVVTIKPRIVENYINAMDLTDSICYNTTLSISGSVESSAPALSGGDDDIGNYSFLWQSSPTLNEVDFVGVDNTADYTEEEVTELQYLRRIVTRGVCEDTSDVLESFVRRLPHGVLTLADGQDNIICESDIEPLKMKVILEGEVDVIDYDIKLTYVSDEGTGTIDAENVTADPGIVEYYPFTDDSATYNFALGDITDNFGCVADEDSMSGTPSVIVYQTPESEIMAMDTAVCGPTIDLNAVADQGGVGHWIKGAGSLGAVFTSPGTESTEVTTDPLIQDSEIMKYGWVLQTPRCGDTAFVEIVHYKDPAGPPYFQRDTIRMYFATDWMLEADVPTAGGGFWTVADGSYGTVPYRSSDTVTLATDLELYEANTFVWNVSNPPVLDQDSAVCGIYEDEITIVRNDLQQFDGFSPGGDGMNDYYVMRGLSEADAFVFTVFNNWGTTIKTLSANTKEAFDNLDRIEIDRGTGDLETIEEIILWDGTISDNVTLAPDGAYYYSISLSVDGDEYTKKGYIVLKTRN